MKNSSITLIHILYYQSMLFFPSLSPAHPLHVYCYYVPSFVLGSIKLLSVFHGFVTTLVEETILQILSKISFVIHMVLYIINKLPTTRANKTHFIVKNRQQYNIIA